MTVVVLTPQQAVTFMLEQKGLEGQDEAEARARRTSGAHDEWVHCNYTTPGGSVKTKIVRIGNSRGIRIPKPLLDEADLGEEVELRLAPEGLMIERVESRRRGWSEAAARLASSHAPSDDPFIPTEFDDADWQW